MLEQNIQTQRGLIIRTMMKKPKTWVLASEFCGGNGSFPFIGYKAPTRISELQCEGYIVSRWSKKTTALGDKLKEYRLNIENYKFIELGDQINILSK